MSEPFRNDYTPKLGGQGAAKKLDELTALREADQATIATLGEINRELADALQHLYASWQSYADWSGNPANAPIRKQTERALRSAGRTP